MSVASEAECGALFINAQKAVPTRITLEELKWKQPPTPMRTDNNTTSGIMNNTVKQNMSKTMDMRFYWLQDRVDQGIIWVYWGPGKENLADYHTKRFAATHHKKSDQYIYMIKIEVQTHSKCVLESLQHPIRHHYFVS